MSAGALAAAAASVASAMASHAKTKNWHQQNKEKFKERKLAIKEKYKKHLTEQELEIITAIESGLESPDLPESTKKCPECRRNFRLLSIADHELDCCTKCRSFWFDTGELSSFFKLSSDIPGSNLTSRPSKYRCPICEEKMREYVFTPQNNLLVDACDFHGVYLEKQELNRVAEIS